VASNKRLTKHKEDTPLPPKKDPKRGFWVLFGEEAPPVAEQGHRQEVQKKREEEARRRWEGYDWLVD
jgi:hypothetical protein